MSMEGTNPSAAIHPRDIPFLPGTAFPDPRRTNYPVGHTFDMNHRTEEVNDEKALAAPTGLTSAYTATLAPLDYDEKRALRTTVSMRQPVDAYFDAAQKDADPGATLRNTHLQNTRGAIGCRKNTLNALMASGVVPDASLLPRNHDEERNFSRQIPKYEPEYSLLDRVVLRFYAFFTEDVQESQTERRRVRHVYIDYYLVDHTIGVLEKTQVNSQLEQGDLIKRHRIPRDYRDESSGYVELDDIQIGGAVVLYNKTFYVYGCNESTRRFLECQAPEGVTVPPNMSEAEIPQDPFLAERRATEQAVMHKTFTSKHVADDKLAKYLRHDREVLNFDALWDNRGSVFGEVRLMSIHFFLSDDTVELVEILPTNSGRDPFPTFLRRQKVPKRLSTIQFAEHAAETSEFYTARDFCIGRVVPIYGRPLLIYSCDEFTRKYMVDELGFTPEQVAPLDKASLLGGRPSGAAPGATATLMPSQLAGMSRDEISALYPPDAHHIGSNQDTVGSCISIHPEAPRTNMLRWLKFGNLCIRFVAKFAPAQVEKKAADGTVTVESVPVHLTQRDRRFIVSYFFSDGTVSVFEPGETTQPGFGNKFLERTQVVNVARTYSQDLAATGRKSYKEEYVDWSDMKVGTVITLNNHWFELLEIDSRSAKVLEALEKAGSLEAFDPAPFL